MIICFLDVVRSTEVMERDGFRATERLRGQLTEVQKSLKLALGDEPNIFIGERQGDGFLFTADRKHGLDVLRAVLTIQQTVMLRPGWLPMRFSLGFGVPSWLGEPWANGSTFNGRDVTLIARLLDDCPSGGVILNRDLYNWVHEYAPELRSLFSEFKATLKGFDAKEPCWVMEPGKMSTIDRITRISGRWMAVLVILGITVVLSLVVVTRGFSVMASDHAALGHKIDRQTCVLTMDTDERKKFRDKFTAESWSAWCPWIMETNK